VAEQLRDAYLLDTNIWLERFLEQERSAEVGRFLAQTPSEQLCLTDFSFHSIGVVLTRLHRWEALLQFVQDAFIEGAVVLISLQPQDMVRLTEVMGEFKLDFDDAYQYLAAEKYDVTLVSFDADFDRTGRRRMTPAELLS